MASVRTRPCRPPKPRSRCWKTSVSCSISSYRSESALPPTLLPRSLADLETTTLRRWRSGHRDLEDAFAERCPRLFRDRADRKRDDTKEAAVAALAVIEALALLFALPPAFAVNRHRIVAD